MVSIYEEDSRVVRIHEELDFQSGANMDGRRV